MLINGNFAVVVTTHKKELNQVFNTFIKLLNYLTEYFDEVYG